MCITYLIANILFPVVVKSNISYGNEKVFVNYCIYTQMYKYIKTQKNLFPKLKNTYIIYLKIHRIIYNTANSCKIEIEIIKMEFKAKIV